MRSVDYGRIIVGLSNHTCHHSSLDPAANRRRLRSNFPEVAETGNGMAAPVTGRCAADQCLPEPATPGKLELERHASNFIVYYQMKMAFP